jgi:hypothetical protein
VVVQVNVVVPPPVPKAEATSEWPLIAIWGATCDRETVPKTKPLTPREAKTAIATVSTVARIGAMALRFSHPNSILPPVERPKFGPLKECRLERTELGVAWVELGPRARLFVNAILNYKMHGMSVRPMINL